MRYLTVITVLLVGSSAISAEFPTKKYDIGFEAVTVFEYKQTLSKKRRAIPAFPPRTESAIIVRTVEANSRASLAGLQPDDLIYSINNSYFRSPRTADQRLSRLNNQSEIKLGIIRRVDDAWEKQTLMLEPISDEGALKLQLHRQPSLDGAFLPYHRVSHKRAPLTRYAPNNFQLYYVVRAGRPEGLYLCIAQLLPGQSQPGAFIVTTPTGKYTFAAEDEPQKPGPLFLGGSLRSPEWEPVKLEILLILAEDWLDEKRQEFQEVEAKHERDFKDFQFDQSSQDSVYRARNKQRLALISEMERINRSIQRAEKNYETLKQRKARLTALRNVPIAGKFNLTDKARTAIKAHYISLTADQKELVNRAFQYGISLGLKEEELIQLEQTSLAEQDLRIKRGKQGWAWIDVPLTPRQLPMLREFITAPKVTVHHDSNPTQTFEVTPEQQAQIQTVLTVFENEGGKVNEN